jgi:cytidine deaminase
VNRHEPLSTESAQALVTEAQRAASNAYAPYSRFRVGAAVLDANGAIHRGANVENASFGLTICAERVALAQAKVAGCAEIVAVAIACVDAPADSTLESRTPCGACRQWLIELAPNAEVLIAGEPRRFRPDELLPTAFSLRP